MKTSNKNASVSRREIRDCNMNSFSPVADNKNTTFQRFSTPKDVAKDRFSQKVSCGSSDVDCDGASLDSYDEDNFELFLQDLDDENNAIRPTLECTVSNCDETLDEEISKLESTLLELEDDSLSDDESEKNKLVLDTTVIKINFRNDPTDVELLDEDALLNDNSNDETSSVHSFSEQISDENSNDGRLSVHSCSEQVSDVDSVKSQLTGQQFAGEDKCDDDDDDDDELLDNMSLTSSVSETLKVTVSNIDSDLDEESIVHDQTNNQDTTAHTEKYLYLDQEFLVVDECGDVSSFDVQAPGRLLLNDDETVGTPVSASRSVVKVKNLHSATHSNDNSLETPILDQDHTSDCNEDKQVFKSQDAASDVMHGNRPQREVISQCTDDKHCDSLLIIKRSVAFQPSDIKQEQPTDSSLGVNNENNCNVVNISNEDSKQLRDTSGELLSVKKEVADEECNKAREETLNAEDREFGEEKKGEAVYVETVVQPACEDFVSNDPLENADNNNPEWEVLRKLETDEERYKAMRQRWRSLVIPNPNQNLTHLHCKFRPPLAPTVNEMQKKKSKKRKRNKTVELPLPTPEVPFKRPRTQSCTSIFDRKVEELQKTVEDKKHQLRVEEQLAIENLGAQQSVEHMQLLNSHINPYRLAVLREQLYQRQREDFELLRERYAHAQLSAEVEVQKKMDAIMKAMEEVRAFHSFYQGLDSEATNKDCLLLTDTELEDILDYERLDEKYKVYYK